MRKEIAMNIVYAAEKPSIASVLSEFVRREISPRDIQVAANPDETGSFLIRWQWNRFVMSPNGEVVSAVPGLVD